MDDTSSRNRASMVDWPLTRAKSYRRDEVRRRAYLDAPFPSCQYDQFSAPKKCARWNSIDVEYESSSPACVGDSTGYPYPRQAYSLIPSLLRDSKYYPPRPCKACKLDSEYRLAMVVVEKRACMADVTEGQGSNTYRAVK